MEYQYIFINALNLCSTGALVWLFYSRDRTLLSPGIALVGLIFYVYSFHFLLYGYDHYVYERMPADELLSVQFWITVTVIFAQFLAFAFSGGKRAVLGSVEDNRFHEILLFVGFLIFAANMIWRANAVDWDADRFVTELLLSRLSEAWAQQGSLNEGSPIDSLIRVLFPFCGYGFAFAATSRSPITSVIAHVLFVITLVFLFFQGSRTYFVTPIFGYLAFQYFATRNRYLFGAISAVAMVAVLYYSNIQLNFRSVGFERIEEFGGAEVNYHMDDNYPRMLYAAWLSWNGEPRVAAYPFISGALLNFIPRAVWPGKPAMSDEYFFPFKDAHYITISMMGELHAAAHPIVAAAFFCLIVVLMTLVSYRIFRRQDAASMATLLIFLLYSYSVLRSIFNFSAAIYLPLLMMAINWMFLGKGTDPAPPERKTGTQPGE